MDIIVHKLTADTSWHGHVLRVRYQETDRMNVVFHGNYVTWFEVGRTEWLRGRGHTYKQLEAQGLLLPVTDLQAQFKKPAMYDDIVIIFTKLLDATPLRVQFQSCACRVSEAEAERLETQMWFAEPFGERLVEGGTTHVWLSTDWRPIRLDRTAPDIWALLNQV
ncbi:acyl-CoA thioesterase [Paenibacillus sp. 481]|uniref:acyl-CoA thioesterase n=1 Tax=Paenibacillus sp. 481 TaxID=2835869 RepID=UPI001E6499AB|nr:thioesterase family protein [Paenibacillus sp. 481]